MSLCVLNNLPFVNINCVSLNSPCTNHLIIDKIVHHIKTKEDLRKKTGEDGLVVVAFYSTWCGGCEKDAPKIEMMARNDGQLPLDFTDVIFTKVDVEENEDIANEYNIKAMPTYILIKKGVNVGDLVGSNQEKKLIELIHKHRGKNISLE